jgi:hypothetical protein
VISIARRENLSPSEKYLLWFIFKSSGSSSKFRDSSEFLVNLQNIHCDFGDVNEDPTNHRNWYLWIMIFLLRFFNSSVLINAKLCDHMRDPVKLIYLVIQSAFFQRAEAFQNIIRFECCFNWYNRSICYEWLLIFVPFGIFRRDSLKVQKSQRSSDCTWSDEWQGKKRGIASRNVHSSEE